MILMVEHPGFAPAHVPQGIRSDLIVRDRDNRIHFEGCAWIEDARSTTWQDIEDVASGQYARCCFPEPLPTEDED